MPHLLTPEERHFQSTLRHAITQGYGVVEGGTEEERAGPNFAGHHVLVQWGCGTNCMEAAIIDAVDGDVSRCRTLLKIKIRLVFIFLPGRLSSERFNSGQTVD
jgi:hypothetical protein